MLTPIAQSTWSQRVGGKKPTVDQALPTRVTSSTIRNRPRLRRKIDVSSLLCDCPYSHADNPVSATNTGAQIVLVRRVKKSGGPTVSALTGSPSCKCSNQVSRK